MTNQFDEKQKEQNKNKSEESIGSIGMGFLMAWGGFSKVPCPHHRWDKDSRIWMLFFLPVIGLAGGCLWAAALLLLTGFNVWWPLIGALLTAIPFFFFGFIHWDGYLDLWDALLSARPDREERVRILKDSAVGAMGVLVAAVSLILLYGAMSSIAYYFSVVSGAPVGLFAKGQWQDLFAQGLWIKILLPGVLGFFCSRVTAVTAVLIREPMKGSQYEDLLNGEGNGASVSKTGCEGNKDKDREKHKEKDCDVCGAKDDSINKTHCKGGVSDRRRFAAKIAVILCLLEGVLLALTVLAVYIVSGSVGLWVLAPSVISGLAARRLTGRAVKSLGGMNGDISGATSVFGEIWYFVIFAVIVGWI